MKITVSCSAEEEVKVLSPLVKTRMKLGNEARAGWVVEVEVPVELRLLMRRLTVEFWMMLLEMERILRWKAKQEVKVHGPDGTMALWNESDCTRNSSPLCYDLEHLRKIQTGSLCSTVEYTNFSTLGRRHPQIDRWSSIFNERY
jgi:hypothetical protein